MNPAEKRRARRAPADRDGPCPRRRSAPSRARRPRLGRRARDGTESLLCAPPPASLRVIARSCVVSAVFVFSRARACPLIPRRRPDRPAMRSTMASAAARPAAIRSWPGWPSTTPVIVVRLPSIRRMARKAKQPPAASSEPVLTPTNPSYPSNVSVLSHGAGDRQRRARRGDDAREHRQAHGPIDDAHLVGGSRDGCVVVAARVGVAGVGHAQRPCGGIHPGNEPVRRAGVPSRQNRGDVVRRRQQQRLQRLPFGQLLSGGDGHDRLLLSAPAVGVGDIGVGERDRRAVLAEPQRVVTEHEIGRHHLRDAGDRSRVLVRAGLDPRLSGFRTNAAWPSAGHTVLGQRLASRAAVLTAKDVDG